MTTPVTDRRVNVRTLTAASRLRARRPVLANKVVQFRWIDLGE
jgi:hypothetical protein